MKNALLFIFGIFLFSTHAFSQTADQEAIKKVCLAETRAYLDFDYDAWASYHVQSADEQLAWNNPDGTYGAQTGWTTISEGMKAWFKEGQKEDIKLTTDHFTIVIQGDMAFVACDSAHQNAAGKTTKVRDFKTLLRSNGQWKLLAVQAFIDYNSGK